MAPSNWPFGIACNRRARLRHIGRRKQRDADQRAHQLVRRQVLRHEQRQHHARHEQHGHQRHAAHEFDEDHRKQPHRGLCERRPSASRMPNGSEQMMPTEATTMVTRMPPHSTVSTGCKPILASLSAG